MSIPEAAILLLLAGGLFFLAVGALGLIRLPDSFTRMHATTKSDTLGAGLILTALILHFGGTRTAFQLAAIIVFIAVTTPVATHLIARAIYRKRNSDDAPGA